MKKASEAPVWYGAEQADAWADGYNSALEGYSPVPEPYRDTVKKLAAVREKRLAELAEENAQLRAELAKKRPETLPGMVAEVYGELDAEDCAMIDREWARMRGYILPTNGTRTLTRPAPQPSSCLNCGDPSNEPFCGTCREMGCTSRLGELLAKICSHEAINEAMTDSWNDICTDTGCHPLDIEHGKGKNLTFSPNHWANQVAKRLFVRALRLREKPSLPVKNDRGAEPQASADTEAELGLYDLGESFLAEYERATKDGCLKNFVCAESPVEVLWHLINKVDELRLEIDQLRQAAGETDRDAVAAIVLKAMQAKVDPDTYGASYAIKINADRAVIAADAILSLHRTEHNATNIT